MANVETNVETGRRPPRRYEEDEEGGVEELLNKLDNDKLKDAVMKYAKSQKVDINDERVMKYVRGLMGPTGDFGDREQDSPVGRRK